MKFFFYKKQIKRNWTVITKSLSNSSKPLTQNHKAQATAQGKDMAMRSNNTKGGNKINIARTLLLTELFRGL